MNLRRPKRILLVEDEALVAMLLEDIVFDLGCEIVGPAMRFEQAAALIESETLDAAILDVNLGGRLSYPLAERLTERKVPFAFATGYGSLGVEWNADVPVLRKPFETNLVSSVLTDLLGGVTCSE